MYVNMSDNCELNVSFLIVCVLKQSTMRGLIVVSVPFLLILFGNGNGFKYN